MAADTNAAAAPATSSKLTNDSTQVEDTITNDKQLHGGNTTTQTGTETEDGKQKNPATAPSTMVEATGATNNDDNKLSENTSGPNESATYCLQGPDETNGTEADTAGPEDNSNKKRPHQPRQRKPQIPQSHKHEVQPCALIKPGTLRKLSKKISLV